MGRLLPCPTPHKLLTPLVARFYNPKPNLKYSFPANYQAVLPAILPFFHIFGCNVLMMNQMMLGCKLVTMPYFKPELFLRTLVQYKASVLFIVPPMGKLKYVQPI